MGTGDAAGEDAAEGDVSEAVEADAVGFADGLVRAADPWPPQPATRMATASRNVGCFTAGIVGVRTRRSAAYFAASAAGAKERVALGGAHRQMRDDAAPGPLTQASAPLSGSPQNRKIPRGETAPGRLGREDARNFRGRTPRS